MTDIMDAYIKGRIAGKRYAIAKDEDASAAKPANPFSAPMLLQGVEWDRGFNDGWSQQSRRDTSPGSAGLSRDPALLVFFRHLAGIFRRA